MSSTTTVLDAPRPDARAAAAPARPARDPFFDNAKMLLVTLVVVGHSWTLLPDTFAKSWVYNFLYLWHVPAFVMVTGYLSRSFTFSRRNLGRLATTVVLPYLLFEALLEGFRNGVGGEHLGLMWVNPHWPMWYLSALFLWRLATPLLRRLEHPMAFAVAVSLLAGLTSGDVLDVERAMGLLPFFVAGLLATPDHLERLRRPDARMAAMAAFALAFALAAGIEASIGTEWLYWRSSYAETHATFVQGVALRAVLLVVAGALALSFCALLPRRRGWFTVMGSASLVVYLCHGFVVKGVSYTGFPAWAGENPGAGLLLATLVAVPVALALAWRPVSSVLGAVVDPVGTWRRSRQPRPGSHDGGTDADGTLSRSRASAGVGA